MYCKKYIGPKYVLLREEFYKEKSHLRKRNENIKNILIFFGGSDLTNETEKAIKAIEMLNRPDITVNVVVGNSNTNQEKIKTLCDQNSQFKFYCQVDNMAELMNEADLAIGAGGTTTWERCFMELPTVVISIAENQHAGCAFIAKNTGIIYYLGKNNTVSVIDIKNAISTMDNSVYNTMIRNMTKLMGGI